jgi:hypothetical protein
VPFRLTLVIDDVPPSQADEQPARDVFDCPEICAAAAAVVAQAAAEAQEGSGQRPR